MKKLLIILKSLEGGGIEKVTLNLIDALKDQTSVKITLVVTQKTGHFLDDFSSKLSIVNLNVPYEFRLKVIYKIIAQLKICLQQQKPDLILSQFPGLNFITVIAWKLSGIRSQLFLAEHTLPPHRLLKLEDQGKLGWIGKITPLLGQCLYPLSNQVIAVSSGIAHELKHSFKLSDKKIQVIYNPVVNDRLFEQAVLSVEHPWFKSGEPPVFLAVGRLSKQKDYPTLLNAFAKVCQTHEARLLILGEGELRKKLETLIKNLNIENSVDMPGFINNPYAYMAKAHTFVLSSIWETFGNVLAEALACGCLVISTDCDYGPREILENGQYGTLVPVGDVNALAEAMISTITRSPDRQLLKAYAQKFSIKSSTDRYIKVLGL